MEPVEDILDELPKATSDADTAKSDDELWQEMQSEMDSEFKTAQESLKEPISRGDYFVLENITYKCIAARLKRNRFSLKAVGRKLNSYMMRPGIRFTVGKCKYECLDVNPKLNRIRLVLLEVIE